MGGYGREVGRSTGRGGKLGGAQVGREVGRSTGRGGKLGGKLGGAQVGREVQREGGIAKVKIINQEGHDPGQGGGGVHSSQPSSVCIPYHEICHGRLSVAQP